MNWLIEADINLFLYLNGKHSPFFDVVMYWLSSKTVWIPLYILLAYIFYRLLNKKIIPLILFAGLVVLLSDQGSGVIKKTAERKRPCHNEYLKDTIHNPTGCGGSFGFVSSHAANTFGLALFLSLLWQKLSKKRIFTPLIFCWAILVSYSRIYNGVHYPADIIGGALLGMLISYLVFLTSKKYILP